MLAEPRLASEAGNVSDRDDEMIVFQLRGSWPKTSAGRHRLVLEIDGFDFPGIEIGSRAEPPDRRDRVQNPDAP